MLFLYYLYIAIALYFSHRLSKPFKNKIFYFGLFIWISLSPVIDSILFVISIPGLPFDLHIDRLLTALCFFLIVHELFKRKRFKSTSPGKLIEERYELWLIVYLCIIFLSTLSNTIDGNLSLKDFIVINTKYLFFPIIYFSIKLFEDNNTFETLKKIIVNLSIFSSIIAIIQLLINDQFFRFGTYEYAFGDTLRATGLFHGEYTLGFFCITSTLFVLTSDRKNNLVLTLNFIAVIFTFHRLSIGLLFVSYFLYFVIHKKNKKTYLSIFSILFFVL
ncbi:MAG: hypothetical protein KKD66_21610, partial [Proteobacteria bacterium]|nr:hypothetical protein [Pseudomonadota bacterium]